MELRITLRTNRYFQNWPIWNLPHYSHSKEICRCLYLYKLLNYNNFLPFGSIMNYINWESLKHQQHTTYVFIYIFGIVLNEKNFFTEKCMQSAGTLLPVSLPISSVCQFHQNVCMYGYNRGPTLLILNMMSLLLILVFLVYNLLSMGFLFCFGHVQFGSMGAY